MKAPFYTCIITLLIATSAYAGPTIKMQEDYTPAYSMEILEDGFAGYPVSSVVSSFCLEKNEFFRPGCSYYAVLNTAAGAGGFGGGNPDPLDERSAFLYTQFINGKLKNEKKLQRAIWYIEDEICRPNSYVQLANEAVNSGQWSGLGNVRVVNLFKQYENGMYFGRAQDQLIAIHPVPTPGALILAGMGTAIVGLLKRRKAAA